MEEKNENLEKKDKELKDEILEALKEKEQVQITLKSQIEIL